MDHRSELQLSLALFCLPLVACLLLLAVQLRVAVETRTAWDSVRLRYQYAPSDMRRACKQVRKGRCPAWFALPAAELADAYLTLKKTWSWRGPYGLVIAAVIVVVVDLGVGTGAVIAGGLPIWVASVSLSELVVVAGQLLGVQLVLHGRDRWATAARTAAHFLPAHPANGCAPSVE